MRRNLLAWGVMSRLVLVDHQPQGSDKVTIAQWKLQRFKATLLRLSTPLTFARQLPALALHLTPSLTHTSRVGTKLLRPRSDAASSLSHPAFSIIACSLRNSSSRAHTTDQPWSKTSASSCFHPKTTTSLTFLFRYIGLALAVASTLAIGNAPTFEQCRSYR